MVVGVCANLALRGEAVAEHWVQVLKKWSGWDVGPSPLTHRHSRMMLVGTLALAAILAIGLAVTVGSPTTKGHQHPSVLQSPSPVAVPSDGGSPPTTPTTAAVASATSVSGFTPAASSPAKTRRHKAGLSTRLGGHHHRKGRSHHRRISNGLG
jgi:hypothetical protein